MNEALGADLWDVSTIGVAAVTSVAAYGGVLVGDLLEASDGIGLYVRPDSPIAQARAQTRITPTSWAMPKP